jgi:hypothetical protein
MKKILILAIVLLTSALAFSQGVRQLPWYVSYTASLSTVATPTFSSGSSSPITISDSNSGLTGFAMTYCTDGTNTCTPGTSYSSPVTVTGSGYIRAKATATGYTASAVGSEAYTISSHGMTVVQAVSCPLVGGGAGPAYTCSFSATPANASILAACVTSSTLLTLSGSPVNIFSSGFNAPPDGVWVYSGVTTGTTSITVTLAGTYSQGECELAVVTGVAISSPVDQPSTLPTALGGSSYATSITTGSVTTTNANDVILGSAFNIINNNYTVGSGYTLIGAACEGASCAGLEYLNVSATGAYNPPMNQSAAGVSDVGTVALKLQ